MVSKEIWPETPPSIKLASWVLYIAILLKSSEGNCAKLTERSPLPLAASRPLNTVLPKNGPKPRIDISVAPPCSRWDEAPVSVSNASPMDSAGKSPISSADKPSTILVDNLLILIESWIVLRMPVTSITSVISSTLGVASLSCAITGIAIIQANVDAYAVLLITRLDLLPLILRLILFSFIMCLSRIPFV